MKTIELLELPDDARELVRECEIKGSRTLLQRGGRPVAMLVSYDEYLALRETIEIANDADLGAMLNAAEDEVSRGEIEEVTDRVHVASSADDAWRALAEHEREAVSRALHAIDDDPIAGAPLFDPLKGLWVYRTGHLRIAYRIAPEARQVLILSITRASAS
ncbi:MAG TPA: type II toxin-antitoxin system Phd/YefM family antitoxin [Thermoanaerobaculia bacterium]|nr:type II toxin-antitoxin system Phd/YefM family antitoxin [Thermoanaerobaculia bacterium]